MDFDDKTFHVHCKSTYIFVLTIPLQNTSTSIASFVSIATKHGPSTGPERN